MDACGCTFHVENPRGGTRARPLSRARAKCTNKKQTATVNLCMLLALGSLGSPCSTQRQQARVLRVSEIFFEKNKSASADIKQRDRAPVVLGADAMADPTSGTGAAPMEVVDDKSTPEAEGPASRPKISLPGTRKLSPRNLPCSARPPPPTMSLRSHRALHSAQHDQGFTAAVWSPAW